MLKLLCIFFGILFLFNVEKASAITTKSPVVKKHAVINIDSTKVDSRAFNQKTLQDYARQKDFQYNDVPVQNLTWWGRFWRWVWKVIGRLFQKLFAGKASWFLFKLLLFTTAAVALAFIIFKILGIDVIKILRGESKNIDIPYGESLENIHEINFDSEIEKAITNRNYKLAVRLLYLASLKQLSDLQLIHWQIDKTNATYLTELADTQHRQPFGVLTSQFEYVWYGDFPVDGESFQNINTLFVNFKKGLS